MCRKSSRLDFITCMFSHYTGGTCVRTRRSYALPYVSRGRCGRSCLCSWAATVTLPRIWRGCLKVEEGLEHFKAMLTSKLADAKSALCKRTAGTQKKKNFRSRGHSDCTLLSIHRHVTWNRLNLNTFWEDVWVRALLLQMNQLWQELHQMESSPHSSLSKLARI